MFPLALFSVPVSGVLLLSMTLSVVVAAYLTPISKIAYTTDMTDEQQVRDLSTIIESLENLGVLDTSHTVCYSLDQMVKVVKNPGSRDWKIQIDLHVQELGSVSKQDNDSNKVTSGSSPTVTGCYGRSVQTTTSAPALDLVTTETPESAADSLEVGAQNASLTSDPEDRLDASAQGSNNSGKHESGLSLAQIMVISSCSIVIGLFFVAALTMRVRNYLKRKRQSKLDRRKMYRSSSLGDRDSQGFSTDSQDSQSANRAPFFFVRPKPLRSHSYKMGSSSGGFSLFYPNDIGGWSHGFSY